MNVAKEICKLIVVFLQPLSAHESSCSHISHACVIVLEVCALWDAGVISVCVPPWSWGSPTFSKTDSFMTDCPLLCFCFMSPCLLLTYLCKVKIDYFLETFSQKHVEAQSQYTRKNEGICPSSCNKDSDLDVASKHGEYWCPSSC